MDTSETKWYEDPIYIKMCDCPEIQKQATPFEHRLDYGKTQDFWHDIWWTEKIEGQLVNGKPIYNSKSKHTWLPRQDQLQEMARHHKEGWYDSREVNNLYLFFDWVKENITTIQDNASMEQLWLAFVMKEKHSKVWDGEKWK